MIVIKDLCARIVSVDKPILQGLNLSIEAGEVCAIMGPNGSGKSTLSYVLAGHNDYEVTSGDILYEGKSLLSMDASERGVAGIFLAFQYPLEIPGVPILEFLKVAMNAKRKAHGEDPIRPSEFIPLVKKVAHSLNIEFDMLKRSLNVGFSGGEKKRAEILQMSLLEPNFCILDETDSGLDIDSMKIVANGINSLRSAKRSMVLITHYQRLLEYVQPDTVHVLYKGKIIQSGDKTLAAQLESDGYEKIIHSAHCKEEAFS